MEAELHRLHAGVAKGHAALRALLGGDELAARRVGEDAFPRATEELPERLTPRASDEVPDGDLERPVPPVVEVHRLADPVDDVGLERVDAHEQTLEQLAVGQRVPARVALDALVGADDDDRRVLVRAGLRIPRRAERRVQRIAVASRLDRRDPHYSPP